MTLDEAIAHAKAKAEELRRKAVNITPADPYYEDYCDCLNCAEEHEQLAEWLKELKRYREADNEQ